MGNSENKIIAKVDGREIRESDLNSLMKNLGKNSAYFQGPEGRKKLVDELIMHELMYSDALEQNLEDDEEFKIVMRNVKKSLLEQYGLRKLFNKITVTEEEIKDYYENHKDKFINNIEDGISFEEAAAQYSSCPSKQAGGDLGRFGKGQMVKEFDDAVFSMHVGEISKPVKTQFGYHIIKLTERIPQKHLSLKEAYQEAKDGCFMEKQEKVYADKKVELSRKYSIEIEK